MARKKKATKKAPAKKKPTPKPGPISVDPVLYTALSALSELLAQERDAVARREAEIQGLVDRVAKASGITNHYAFFLEGDNKITIQTR